MMRLMRIPLQPSASMGVGEMPSCMSTKVSQAWGLLIGWYRELGRARLIVLAVTSVADGVREHLRRSCKGSRIVVIPDDIFPCLTGGDE